MSNDDKIVGRYFREHPDACDGVMKAYHAYHAPERAPNDDEMRRLMIESSEKLERLLRMKRSDPEKYNAFVRRYHKTYCRGWKRG